MVLREYNNFRRYTRGNTRENTYDYKNFNRNYSGRSRFPLYDGIGRVYTFRYLYFTLAPHPYPPIDLSPSHLFYRLIRFFCPWSHKKSIIWLGSAAAAAVTNTTTIVHTRAHTLLYPDSIEITCLLYMCVCVFVYKASSDTHVPRICAVSNTWSNINQWQVFWWRTRKTGKYKLFFIYLVYSLHTHAHTHRHTILLVNNSDTDTDTRFIVSGNTWKGQKVYGGRWLLRRKLRVFIILGTRFYLGASAWPAPLSDDSCVGPKTTFVPFRIVFGRFLTERHKITYILQLFRPSPLIRLPFPMAPYVFCIFIRKTGHDDGRSFMVNN